MIRAILLDFDTTLLQTSGDAIFRASLPAIGQRAGGLLAPDEFADMAQAAMQSAMQNTNPLHTIEDLFFDELHHQLDCPPGALVPLFKLYFEGKFGEQQINVAFQPGARKLLEWLVDSPYQTILAAAPLITPQVLWQHLDTGDLSPDAFEMPDHLHFARPHEHYFVEILERLDLLPDEVLVVGANWAADIQSAARTGAHTFWVTDEPPAHYEGYQPGGAGSLDDLLSTLQTPGGLDTLPQPQPAELIYAASLLGSVAALDSLLRDFDDEALTHVQDDGEWSARDILCHLRDHELEIDRPRLAQIMEAENAFISATGYDPTASTAQFAHQDARDALREFAERRIATVNMLNGMAPVLWQRRARHSIFGPTSFGEMVQFMAEHDRIHRRQMRLALAKAPVS